MYSLPSTPRICCVFPVNMADWSNSPRETPIGLFFYSSHPSWWSSEESPWPLKRCNYLLALQGWHAVEFGTSYCCCSSRDEEDTLLESWKRRFQEGVRKIDISLTARCTLTDFGMIPKRFITRTTLGHFAPSCSLDDDSDVLLLRGDTRVERCCTVLYC